MKVTEIDTFNRALSIYGGAFVFAGRADGAGVKVTETGTFKCRGCFL